MLLTEEEERRFSEGLKKDDTGIAGKASSVLSRDRGRNQSAALAWTMEIQAVSIPEDLSLHCMAQQ